MSDSVEEVASEVASKIAKLYGSTYGGSPAHAKKYIVEAINTQVEARTAELEISLDAALSREKEANRDWSTAAKDWVKEKTDLEAQLAEVRQARRIISEIRYSYKDRCNILETELAEAKAEIECLAWNLAACEQYALGYDLDKPYDEEMARSAMITVRARINKLQENSNE